MPCHEYLGTFILENGNIHQEIRKRPKKASYTYYKWIKTLFSKEEISSNTKTQAFKTIIQPICDSILNNRTISDVLRKGFRQIVAVEMKTIVPFLKLSDIWKLK